MTLRVRSQLELSSPVRHVQEKLSSLLHLLCLLQLGSVFLHNKPTKTHKQKLHGKRWMAGQSFNNLSSCQIADFWQQGEGQNKSESSSCNLSSA